VLNHIDEDEAETMGKFMGWIKTGTEGQGADLR
jgi:hypothetical protein